jgi:uncharacterized protein YceK
MKNLLLIAFVLLLSSCGEIKKQNQAKRRAKTKEASQLLVKFTSVRL